LLVQEGQTVQVNAIVARKIGARATLGAARLSNFSIDGIYLNMNNLGNRGLYIESCWDCYVQNIIVDHLNCTDGGVYIQADQTGTTVNAETYFLHMTGVQSLLDNGSTAQANTTCHPFYFDSSKGEIAYGVYNDLYAHGSAAASGGGSDSIYINTGTDNTHESFDQNVFINPKTSEPATGAYGIK
jgi:hypothetical protein